MNKDFEKRSVLLITIDALRPDHLKIYNYHRDTAPNLEKFAQKGTIFMNALTNGPETPTSFSSIFTSILPFLDGGYSPLPLHKIPFPLLLKENKIQTYSIHSNPNLGSFFNYDRGFDVFLDGERYKRKPNGFKSITVKQQVSYYLKRILDFKDLFRKLMFRLKGFNKLKSWVRKKIPSLTDILLPFTPIAYNAPYITNKVISFLSNATKPFFIWAHYMDVHSPYNPPKQNVLNFRKEDINISEREFLTKKVYSGSKDIQITTERVEDLKILYDGEIHFVDEFLGSLFNFVNSKFKTNFLIILAADHGESFFEHGLSGHMGSVYEEILKVPLIIVEMGKTLEVKQVFDTVQLIDVAPTILDYFGIKIPENFQGTSLLPILEGIKLEEDRIIISECYQNKGLMKRNRKEGYILLSIRKQDWKYIYNEEEEKEYLFNLGNDPAEKINLIGKNQMVLDEFRKIKDKHLQNALNSSEEKSRIMKAIKSLKNIDLK